MAAAFVSETTFTSGTTAVTTPTVAGPAAPANLAVLRIHRTSAISGGAITGVTDTAGNTWRLATRGGVSGSTKTRYECWYAEGYVPAATITMTGPSFPTAGSVLGFSGMANSGALEVASPDYSGVGTAATTITTPTITTTVAGDLVIAGVGHGATTTAGTVGSPWTRTAGAPPWFSGCASGCAMPVIVDGSSRVIGTVTSPADPAAYLNGSAAVSTNDTVRTRFDTGITDTSEEGRTVSCLGTRSLTAQVVSVRASRQSCSRCAASSSRSAAFGPHARIAPLISSTRGL